MFFLLFHVSYHWLTCATQKKPHNRSELSPIIDQNSYQQTIIDRFAKNVNRMCAPHNVMRRKPNCNININVAWPPGNFILNRIMETFILARFNKSQCNELPIFSNIRRSHYHVTDLSNFPKLYVFAYFHESLPFFQLKSSIGNKSISKQVFLPQ